MRNMLATLLLSQGTPMITAGDEFARTQQGNNNAYCQDSEISWVDWTLCEKNASQVEFVRYLTGLRHKYPILRRNLFLNGEYIDDLGVRDVTWINQSGVQMSEEDWNSPDLRCFGMLLDGRAPTTGIRQRGKEATILLVVNGSPDDRDFQLPECTGGSAWSLIFDTTVERAPSLPPYPVRAVYKVQGRALLAFVLQAG
jgi:isoamylase